MKRGRTKRETCDLNGWGVGTRLVGDEGYGPRVIEITGLGRANLLAVCVSRNGKATDEHECSWTLTCREWIEAGPAIDPAATIARTHRTPPRSDAQPEAAPGAIPTSDRPSESHTRNPDPAECGVDLFGGEA